MIKMTLLQETPAVVVGIVIFVLIIVFFSLGNRLRDSMIRKDPEHVKTDLKPINGMLIGLLGLLLAFTFSMSNSRFDTRRELVVREANIIGTAILRTDIYPDSVRKLLRSGLKDYLEARIAFYQAGMNIENAIIHYREADSIGKKIWSIAAGYARINDITTRTSQLIPALNELIDITTTRKAAGEGTIPDSIMYFLFTLCCITTFLLGYDYQGKIDWIIVISFSIMLSATVFTIIDLDRPRGGLIKLDKANQNIVELREMFKGD